MNSNLSLFSLLFVFAVSLSACGGGDVSDFRDDDISSPVGEGIDDGEVRPSDPGADSVGGDTLADLPRVDAGNRIFADPNVLVRLNGSAEAAADASIVETIWTQVDGPVAVAIPNAGQLVTQILVPDVTEETSLVFRLSAVDSLGRINSSSLNVVVTPSSAFARVISEVVEIGQESVAVNVRLNAQQDSDVSVTYQTEDGTALAGRDYEAVSGTVLIPAGEVSARIIVPILPGSIDGVDQSFSLRISVVSAQGQGSSNIGVVWLRDSPDAQLLPPSLVQPEELTLAAGIPMAPLSLVNQGGGQLNRCEVYSEAALPVGLTIGISEDASTCVISGTPLAQQPSGSPVPEPSSSPEPQPSTSPEPQPSTSPEPQPSTSPEPQPSVSPVPQPSGAAEPGPSEPPLASQTTIVAANQSGESMVSLRFVIVEETVSPPDLTVVEGLRLSAGVAIAPIVFSNSGGGELIRCSLIEEDLSEEDLSEGLGIAFTTFDGEFPGLPAGLELEVSEDRSTCIISGTPVSAELRLAEVIAENAGGVSASVSIAFEVSTPPVFAEVGDQRLFLMEGNELIFVDLSDGLPLESCAVAQPLPAGLELSVGGGESDGCVISGEPSAVAAAANYTITGTNVDGSTEITFSIEVQDSTQSLALNLATFADSCAIGVAVNEGLAWVDWGDGTAPSGLSNRDPEQLDATEAGALEHRFQSEQSGVVTLTLSRGLGSLTGLADNACAFAMNVDDLSGAENLELLKLTGVDGSLEGSMASLARNHPLLRDLELQRVRSDSIDLRLTGLLSELPPALERFHSAAGFLLTENALLTDLPQSLQTLDLASYGGTIGGSIENLPPSLTRLRVAGSSDIGGDLSALRSDMALLDLGGVNNVTGALSTIANQGGLSLRLFGDAQTQISASVAGVPSSITSLVLEGSIPVDGDIGDLHPDMSQFLIFSEQAAIGGDIAALQSNAPIEVAVRGATTIFGNIADISTQLVSLELGGQNTLTGNIQAMHADFERLIVYGQNSLAGDIGLIAANNLLELSVGGLNTIADFSATPTWSPNNLHVIELVEGSDAVGAGFADGEIDAVLIYLNSVLSPLSDPGAGAVVALTRINDGFVDVESSDARAELVEKGFQVRVRFGT